MFNYLRNEGDLLEEINNKLTVDKAKAFVRENKRKGLNAESITNSNLDLFIDIIRALGMTKLLNNFLKNK